jgi:hypothetical protein
MTTIQEIHNQIAEEAKKIGIDIDKLRTKTAIQWFPLMGNLEASFQLDVAAAEFQSRAIDQKTFEQRRAQIVSATGPVIIRVGDRFPLNPAMCAVAIFGDDAEWRVYALPIKSDDDDPNKPHPRPACYTLSRHAAVLDLEAMPMETFVSEIIDEWAVVDSAAGARKIEQDAIVAYLQTLPDDYSVKQAARDIADEIHLEGDEEEPEPESGPKEQATVNGQPAA